MRSSLPKSTRKFFVLRSWIPLCWWISPERLLNSPARQASRRVLCSAVHRGKARALNFFVLGEKIFLLPPPLSLPFASGASTARSKMLITS